MSDEQRSADETAREYAEELRRWRERRGLSKRGLALLMSYDRSYVSQIEGCHLPPTEDFTRRAEAVLTAGDSLWARWEEYEAAKRKVGLGGGRVRAGAPLSAVAPLGGELFAEHDDAALTYDGRRYHLKMSRHLHNEGEAAVTRYLMRVSVDRYPGEPEPPTSTTAGTRWSSKSWTWQLGAVMSPWHGRSSWIGTRSKRSGCCSRTMR